MGTGLKHLTQNLRALRLVEIGAVEWALRSVGTDVANARATKYILDTDLDTDLDTELE